MKKTIILITILYIVTATYAQQPPRWLNEQSRESNYPNNVFYTGFATGSIRTGETKEAVLQRLRKEAQGYCVEAIRVNVHSTVNDYSKSIKQMAANTEAQEKIEAIFESTVKTEATAEITGLKVETYADADGLLHAFAYVNKYELIGYYNASLTMNLQQLESMLQMASEFETSGSKSKAKKQYQDAVPLLVKVEQAQDILVAIDNNATAISLQRDKTASYRRNIIQAMARLEQGIYVYVESRENAFGKQEQIIANKLKAVLASNDCSFTDNPATADYKITINASTRKIGDENAQIVFCYADVTLSLFDTHKQKSLYSDEFSQKGGSTTFERAAREALQDAASAAGEKVLKVIKN